MNQSKRPAYKIPISSHKQKKYFSLMLVPSYTSGKTRSVRISQNTFYAVSFTIVVILSILLFLHIQSRVFNQTITYVSTHLEQTLAAYEDLQAISEQENDQLIARLIYLQNNLTTEVIGNQRELLNQQRDFLDDLASIRAYAESLEARLWQYEIYRQEIIDRLNRNAHLPAVSNALDKVYQSQLYLLSEFIVSPECLLSRCEEAQGILLLANPPTTTRILSPVEIENELIHYIATLELALEAQKELYTQLKEQVSIVAPHIRRDNYGPRLLYWSYVRTILPQNTPVRITDVRTGTNLYVISFSHGNHADVVPATADDTAALHRVFNGRWSWDTRPIWVHIDDRKVAASINGMPHAGTSFRNNNMHGHVCMHFRGSRTHNGSVFHERDHQNSVMEAYRANF